MLAFCRHKETDIIHLEQEEGAFIMGVIDSILMELDQEAVTTRRVLERVPNDKLSWRPHPKSMSLAQLAQHVATIPGGVAAILAKSEFEAPDFANQPGAVSAAELLPALHESVEQAKSILRGFDEAAMMAPWKLTRAGKQLLSAPRGGLIRSILLNHWYHHRGQLSVYLRLLDTPVPSIYGPSADENPFG
jgi:uncharacterized damage-inducible protein DinB